MENTFTEEINGHHSPILVNNNADLADVLLKEEQTPPKANGLKRKPVDNSAAAATMDTINERTSRLGLQTDSSQPESSSQTTPSSIVPTREKRIRKLKAYDDDFVMFNPLPSLSANSSGGGGGGGGGGAQSTSDSPSPIDMTPGSVSSPPLLILEPCAYAVGDIVWAKMSLLPWWPCMISTPKLALATNPQQMSEANDDFIRYMSASRRHKRMFYVEFFGPVLEHGWAMEANVIAYRGGDPFEFFKEHGSTLLKSPSATRSNREKIAQKFFFQIAPQQQFEWNAAVKEADEAMSMSADERKLLFTRKHSERPASGIKKVRSLSSSVGTAIDEQRNEFDDLDNHSDPFDLANGKPASKKRHLSHRDERGKFKLAKRNFLDQERDPENSCESFEDQNQKIKYEVDEDADEEDGFDESIDQEMAKRRKKKPKMRTSQSSVSEMVDGEGESLNEKQVLRLIKNRLSAITCMDNNPLNVVRIAQKYHISKQLIMKDYFGFNDSEEDAIYGATAPEDTFEDEVLAKLDEIRHDLDRIGKAMNGGSGGNESGGDDSETVPRALVALKFRVPMVFVRKLAELETTERHEVYKKLVELKNRLWENRLDLKRLNQIVNEGEELGAVKCEIKIEAKEEPET